MKDKKTLVSINLCNSGSTGGIMMNVSAHARRQGFTTYQCYPDHATNRPARDGDIIICSEIENKIYQRICRYIGVNGCSAFFVTQKLLRRLDRIQPDVIQLHNLHHSYINLPLLFQYLRKNDISVVWTLHDCWAFTGHCPHFAYIGCQKWKNGCYDCSQYKEYPESAFDDSRRMYRFKQKWFNGVEKMVLVTPSQWLANLVKQSFLKKYPVRVINNGIDLSVFYPRESDFREKHGISPQVHVILGVAFNWGSRKGIDIMIKLAQVLPENYRIVLVGTDKTIEQTLPLSIVSIHRTNSRQELAEIYSTADLFVNPTREETYPTVNMEALACGTPVLTFRTGGSPEIIDEKTGSVVECDDFEMLHKEVVRICEEKPFNPKDCLERAKFFNMDDRFNEYLELYSELLTN